MAASASGTSPSHPPAMPVTPATSPLHHHHPPPPPPPPLQPPPLQPPHTPLTAPPPPAIAALFVVVFDHRKGSVLHWHKSVPNVQVGDAVEFKSLPSGLHNVSHDLVYFVHGKDYAGVSAYVNRPDATAERHALQLAVGVLVPVDADHGGGRMGKSWRHADQLKALAGEQAKHKDSAAATQLLDAYWQEHRLDDSGSDEGDNVDPHDVKSEQTQYHHQPNRSMSLMSSFMPDDAAPSAANAANATQSLSPHHPAATLLDMISEFGPLIFPLYRAALLRKRILLVTEAPVEFACNMVYNLSVLSSLPSSLLPYLPNTRTNPSTGAVLRTSSSSSPWSSSPRRIPALFNIGLMDIDDLSHQYFPDGWIACTTDDVLATKPLLYDVAVYLPSKDSSNAGQKVYPKIFLSGGENLTVAANKQHQQQQQQPLTRVRASQRDAVRYSGLVQAIKPFPKAQILPSSSESESPVVHQNDEHENTDNDTASTLSSNAPSLREQQDLVEPSSWSRVAYTSLLWWATAGDRTNGLTADEEEQMERDALLFDRSLDHGQDQSKEVAIVGYFRRLTATIFQAIHEVIHQEEEREVAVDDGDEEEEEEETETGVEGDAPNGATGPQSKANHHPFEHHHQPSFDEGDQQRPLLAKNTSKLYHDQVNDDGTLVFTADDLSAMGLDVWSQNDSAFVEELLRVWFKRKAQVRSGRVECCGLRIL